MPKDIIEIIYQIVKKECGKKTNYWGYSAFTHHFKDVYKNAQSLAKKLGADYEICSLSALFHDFACVHKNNDYENHHLESGKLAEKILRKYNYPQEKIELIKKCIYEHRASKNIKKTSLESKILASADAMSHFQNIPDLFFMVYKIHNLKTDEGLDFVLKKLERSYKKLIPEAKKIIEPQYKAIKVLIK